MLLLGVGLILAVIGSQVWPESTAKPKGTFVGKIDLGQQYGLRGVDFASLEVRVLAMQPDSVYTIPKDAFWVDAFAGTPDNAWVALKVWQDSRYHITRTEPVTFNWTTIQQGNRHLGVANRAGQLGISVPSQQADFSDGDSAVESATLIVVTKKKKST